MVNKALKEDLSIAEKTYVMHDAEMKAYYQRRTAMGKKLWQ